jgi:hypothetical protein
MIIILVESQLLIVQAGLKTGLYQLFLASTSCFGPLHCPVGADLQVGPHYGT